MTAAEMLPLLVEWKAQRDKITAAYAPLESALALRPENAIHKALWGVFNTYTKTLAPLIGDEYEWLIWYDGDNDMGAAGYRASPGNGHQHRAVRTLEDLARLIVESRV